MRGGRRRKMPLARQGVLFFGVVATPWTVFFALASPTARLLPSLAIFALAHLCHPARAMPAVRGRSSRQR